MIRINTALVLLGSSLVSPPSFSVTTPPLDISGGSTEHLDSINISNTGSPGVNTISVREGSQLLLNASNVINTENATTGISTQGVSISEIFNTIFNSSGNGSFALSSVNGGTTTVSNSVIFTESGSSGVLSTDDQSVVNIYDSAIKSSSIGNPGHNTAGITAEFNGTVNADNVSISTIGDYSSGLHTQASGVINISNSNVNTKGDNSAGIASSFGSNVNATNIGIATTGDNSHGVEVNSASIANIRNANIIVEGNASALKATGAGSIIALSNSNIVTNGILNPGVLAENSASLSINESNIEVNGNSVYGVSASGLNTTITLNNIKIKTTGDIEQLYNTSSNGVVSEFGANVVLAGTNVIETHGESGIGVLSQVSGVNLDTSISSTGNLDITTFGDRAFGLVSCSLTNGDRFCSSLLSFGEDGVSQSSKSSIDASSTSIKTSGENSYAAYANGKDSTVSLTNVALTTIGNNSHAVAVRKGTANINKGDIKAEGNGSSAIAIYNGGNITLQSVRATSSSGSGISIASSDSSDTANLTITDSFILGGNAGLTSNNTSSSISLSNSYLGSKDNILVSNNNSVISLDTSNSILSGQSIINNGGTTNLVMSDNSIWYVTGNSVVSNLNVDNSSLFISSESVGETLIVNNSYHGNNAHIFFDTILGNDDSKTDQLIINGDTSGNTTVFVNNVGGLGAKTLEGIKLIHVEGASNGNFTQSGRIVAGAYDYFLTKGGDPATQSNWYLTSSLTEDKLAPFAPTVRPEVGSYIHNLATANTMFVTQLNDRLGETQYTDIFSGEKKVTSLWLRQVGHHNDSRTSDGQLKTQGNGYIAQLGGDIAQWSSNGDDRIHIGLMAGYGNDKSKTQSNLTGYNSSGFVEGYSVGLYGTWFENGKDETGSYLDSWAQYSWFNNNVNGDQTTMENYKSNGFTASIEFGHSFNVSNFENDSSQSHEWFIQPQAQVTWMGVSSDPLTESNGTQVKGKGDGNVMIRLGARSYVNYINKSKGAVDTSFKPYVEANLIHNTNEFGVQMNEVSSQRAGAKNIGELKLGIEGKLNENLNVWGGVSTQFSSHGYSENSLSLGLKYHFN